MNHLLMLVLLTSAAGLAESNVSKAKISKARISHAKMSNAKISDCFKVSYMTKMDAEFYWASWVNTCPYTIDSVYVMVEFADHLKQHVGNGVWGLHFIQPGAHRVIRFTAPVTSAEYHTITLRKITTNSEEALRDPGELPRRTTSGVGDPGASMVSH